MCIYPSCLRAALFQHFGIIFPMPSSASTWGHYDHVNSWLLLLAYNRLQSQPWRAFSRANGNLPYQSAMHKKRGKQGWISSVRWFHIVSLKPKSLLLLTANMLNYLRTLGSRRRRGRISLLLQLLRKTGRANTNFYFLVLANPPRPISASQKGDITIATYATDAAQLCPVHSVSVMSLLLSPRQRGRCLFYCVVGAQRSVVTTTAQITPHCSCKAALHSLLSSSLPCSTPCVKSICATELQRLHFVNKTVEGNYSIKIFTKSIPGS